MEESYLQNGIITESGIQIDKSGKWFHRNQEITNAGILNYFKRNLFRIQNNYYIHNQFKERNEFSRIQKISGFPIFATGVISTRSELFVIHLDYGEDITVSSESFLFFDETTLGILLKEKNFPARLTGTAMSSLMDYLDENSNGEYTIGDQKIVIPGAKLSDYF
ncbi:MAG: hypothetical protein OEZ34_05435 [Spirochaetia bacterium]|nr:hypothetical protein [Spirochaetia bacterium]